MLLHPSRKEFAADVIKLAQKHGADLVAVSLGSATSYQIEVREQQIDLLKESSSSGIDISLSKDQKRSSISSNDLRLEILEPLIESMLQTLPYMDADPFYCLPDPQRQGTSDLDLGFVDPDFDQKSARYKLEQALVLEQKALSLDDRIRVEQSYYSDMTSYSLYADSNGFIGESRKTLCSVGVSTFVEDAGSGENTARKQTDGWYSCSRRGSELESLDSIAQKSVTRCLRKIGAQKPKSQEVPVVFCPEMAGSFFGTLASALMGDQVFRKNSFLAGRLETLIGSPQIHLVDNPHLYGRLGSRHFDSEGVLSQPLCLIENGVLKNFMLSTYSAKKLGKVTTGHAGGVSNLVLRPGSHTEMELIESIENGLYLTSMSGQGANIGTGDYSRGAQGLWIRDGKLAEPVNEFTIASTFMGVLKNIQMIADRPDQRSSILAPAFKVEKMAISGA